MRVTSGKAVNPEPHQQAPHGPSHGLQIEVLEVTDEGRRAANRRSRLVQMRRRVRTVALMYAGAASILPLVLATVLALTVPFAPTRNVVVTSATLFIGFFLVYATPV